MQGLTARAKQTGEGLRKVDVHHHIIPDFYHELLASINLSAGIPMPAWSPEAILELMDSLHIDTAILSLSAPGVMTAGGRDDVRGLVRGWNDYAFALRATHPQRFGFFAALPGLMDQEGVMTEIQYAFENLKADGATLFTSYNGKYLGAKEFELIWATLKKHHAVVHVHPVQTASHRLPSRDYPYSQRISPRRVEAPVFGLQDYPVTAGGTLPYVAEWLAVLSSALFSTLLDDNAPRDDQITTDLKLFYFDLALGSSTHVLDLLLNWAPHDRILYGSDFPFATQEACHFDSSLQNYNMSNQNWKVRKQGYEDAAKTFETTPDESDPAFRPFLFDSSLWKGAVADSNVAAQQDGIYALCAFLKYGGPQACTKSRNVTVIPIVEKGLSSTRAATKQSALEALLLYVELDKSDPIIDDLLQCLNNKQPKIISATLAALTAIFHAYGIKIVDPKPVLKALPKVFGHADKNVRAEAQNLAVELYRWLREAMKTLFWGELKPVQQQDLEKLFEAVKQEPSPRQERLLRSQQAAEAASSGAQQDGDAEAEAEDDQPAEIDAFDLAEPVDVLGKVPADFHESMASTKWKDRKDALDALFAAVNTDRIKDGSFDEIVAALAKSMKDTNIAVVTVAANCIECIAKGLRHGFAKYRSRIMPPIMERLKEKKQSVADALGAALDAVFASTGLSECLEDILEFLKHKNPQVKSETLKFLIRCLRTTREAPSKHEVKLIAEAATKLLTESVEATRSGGAEVLGTLMKIMGERAMGLYMEGLDDIRKTKIKEFCDAAEVKAKDKPKPVAPPPKAAPTGQKRTATKKPALGAKKPATPAATPQEETAPPPKAPTSKGIPSKLSAPKALVPPQKTGLQAPKKTPSSGIAAPPSLASPRRNITPQSADEDSAPIPSKLGRGGLAGRPLARPAPHA
ncbi:MAG: hypothetical protein Q9181_007120, partial [Wetmoreana brouardii]